MSLTTRLIEYTDGDTVLEGFFAFPTDGVAPLPCVLIAHMWDGRSVFVCSKARELAKLGYAAFALDMYGQGVIGHNPEENSALLQPFVQDRTMIERRMGLALETLAGLPEADGERIAAIGFCFGGMCVLDLARSNPTVCGVVSFHGLLDPPPHTGLSIIPAKVLVLHGHNDPMATPDKVSALQAELTARHADWQIHVYGNTMHAFTNPQANDPDLGTVYKPRADQRSWESMKLFLDEVLNC